MIVTAVALLVVATIFLVIGILSSSVAWLVLSVCATAAASATLVASFAHYRTKAERPAGYPTAYGAAAPPPPQPATAPTPVVDVRDADVPPGWDDRPATELTRIVGTLSIDELHAARRREVEGKHRKTVLAAIDGRIDEIVEVRRTLQST